MPSRDFFSVVNMYFTMLTLFAKIKFSRKFPNLQYVNIKASLQICAEITRGSLM